jgi:YD repeat-containing protein
VSHFPTTGNEDTSQRVTYIYDTNSLDTSHTFSNYTSGRLAAVQYGPVNTSTTNPSGTYLPTFAEWYNYQLSGLVATKRLQVLQSNYGITTPQAINFDGAYTYDTGGEGKILSVQYPSTSAGSGSKYTYSFDSMYRPVGMTDQNSNTDVSNVTYNPANQLLSINYFGSSETRTYNSLNQLTNVTGPGISKTYTYTAGANIGKISSQTDALSGETVQYVYDSLNRLYSATTTAGTAWSQTFTYDPFGNLTAKTGTGTAPPSIPVSAQPSALDAEWERDGGLREHV